ncbi:caspase family protein [Streptomyces sp. VRA16 Mangrove soil]|uniref:HD domain-containing protein n=1 Tax=Streptomyces sp. VRA16 Mangrove soil TaxID=2817434 RepID=UPI001A9E11BB|nr:caspase family protein [Streptomyces sp. VRA16 Mangrove soil]MBO1331697.1 caspase family protein [Streptomyces sp. VRA16 Mangrove soil]
MNDVRKALLLGVGQVPEQADGLEQLDAVVHADLQLMESALRSAGYTVETLLDPHLSQLKRRVYECARDIPADGTLLLYFTGHGIRIAGQDYLVPADAVWPEDGVWHEVYSDSLLHAGISPLLKGCKAGTVLWVIDACRAGETEDGVPFGSNTDSGPPTGDYAVLTGCSRGERSGYGPEGSFFTQGLAEALGPLSPARTVTEVFTAARRATERTARRVGGITQTPAIKYVTQDEARARGTEICPGRSLKEDWLAAALDTPLWDRVPQGQHGEAARFRQCLADFVEQCARTLHHAQERLPHDDPWADDTFVVRLLHQRLPELLPATAELSAIEVASLVTVVFLREVAWAERLSQAAEVDPYVSARKPGADAYRRHYEQIAEQHQSVARRAVECRARGRVRDTAAVTMWLVHRWIADRFETDDAPVAPALARRLLESMGVSPERAQEPAEALSAMAAGLGTEEPPAATAAPEKVLLPEGHRALRIRPLTGLLRLAAVLAVDVRTFPDVVAEHLGVSDPVMPGQVIGALRELGWAREGEVLHLDALCPHQAVHAALTAVVERADELAEETAGLAGDLPAPESALLACLPQRVTDRDVRPSLTAGRPSYEVPLLRFHLAQTEVRELLMGEQLYGGEPNLALRELYQNAMDACRYRAMRWRYLRSRGTDTGHWTGEITFSEGEDERGRYVECRDNGVGMSAEQLKHTFTRAGSRFERSKTFRREQARWLRHDPALRLYPNSRFGIGVFSYFMLAEEMTIVTRQVSPEGIPAEHALRVDIPSSGSLFRIQQHSGADGLADGGTRVRLYLREGALAGGASCVSVLRELVRIAEFTLTARDAEGGSHTWRPGVLQPSPAVPEEHLEAVPGVLWWVSGEGAVLCDGIVTDRKPFGCVLNLTGEHAGVLSVSRKELQDFDRAWATERWREGAAALSAWPRLTMEWVWELDRSNPAVAVVLGEEWRGRGLRVRDGDGTVHELDAVGWFHPDARLMHNRYSPEFRAWEDWRGAVLRHRRSAPSPRRLTGHPVPRPGDGHLGSQVQQSWPDVVQYAADNAVPLAGAMRRRRALGIAAHCWVPRQDPARPVDLDWVPSGEQADFVAQLTSKWSGYEEYRQGPWIPGELHDIPRASAKLLMPLATLAAQIVPFEPFGLPQVPQVPDQYRRHVCDTAELDRLFVRKLGYSPTPPVHASDIRHICEETGDSPEAVLDVVAAHAWLGWTAFDLADVLPWMDISEEDFAFLSRYRFSWLGEHTLPWSATVELASQRSLFLGEAEGHLTRLSAALGLTYRPAFASPEHPAWYIRPTETTVEYADRSMGRSFDVTAPPLLSNLIGCDDTSVDQLRTLGAPIPRAHRLAQRWPQLPLRLRYALSGREYPPMEESDYPAERFGTATLFNAACLLQEPLRGVLELVRPVADQLGLCIPDVPGELLDHQPIEAERDALLGYVDEYGELNGNEYGEAVWVPLTPPRLARRARSMGVDAATALDSLLPLRSMGALLPELGDDAVDRLGEEEPDGYDLHVLQKFWPTSPDGSHRVSPLALVRAAARIGDTASETVARYAPYLPLVAHLPDPPPDLSAAPDTVPLWQDLIILTRYLNGDGPALDGRVGPADIARAADAVGESPTWVAERLRLYAALFDLHITEDVHD